MKTRLCVQCGAEFGIFTQGDNARKYCSGKCAKKAAQKRTKLFFQKNPSAMNGYNKARLAKNPGAWIEKHREERRKIIAALGGKCAVPDCEVTNQYWLHVDYIPTTRNRPFRHPRHPAYVLTHKKEFRLLCANHHYELTLTGRIEDSTIKAVRIRSS